MIKWYEKSGECADVVISSRARLARNIAKYPFPCKLNNMTISGRYMDYAHSDN